MVIYDTLLRYKISYSSSLCYHYEPIKGVLITSLILSKPTGE